MEPDPARQQFSRSVGVPLVLPLSPQALAEGEAGGEQDQVAQGAAGGRDADHGAEIDEGLELAGPQRGEADGHGHAGKNDPRPAHAVALEEPLPEPRFRWRWNCKRQ